MGLRIEPDNYAKDWRGFARNQLGHILLGVLLAFAVCYGFWFACGEFPYRWKAWLVVAAFYIVVIEYLLQWAWQKLDPAAECKLLADSVQDTVFVVVYGAGGTLYAAKEVDAMSGGFIMNAPMMAPFVFFASINLALGIAIRVYWANRVKYAKRAEDG